MHPVLGRGPAARAPVGEVVGDRAIEHDRTTFALRHPRELRVKLALAVVAAIGGIAREHRVGQLAGGDGLDARTEARGLFERQLQFA